MAKEPINECSRNPEEIKKSFPFPECDRCEKYDYEDGLCTCEKISQN